MHHGLLAARLHLAVDQADLEIAQLTGAICPGDDGVYRPGLWIVLEDRKERHGEGLALTALEYARAIADEFAKRLGLS